MRSCIASDYWMYIRRSEDRLKIPVWNFQITNKSEIGPSGLPTVRADPRFAVLLCPNQEDTVAQF